MTTVTPPLISNPFRFKSNKFQAQGNQVRQMLQKVSTILYHLLQDLEIIYKSNGIDYSIDHYHQPLIRILTPFELLSQFWITDNSNIIKLDGVPTNINPTGNLTNQIQKGNSKNQQLKLIPTPPQYKQRNKKKNKQEDEGHTNKKIRQVLSELEQSILTEWAMNRLSKNKWVQRKDLAKKALQLTDRLGFSASKGWVNKFLRRHPQLYKQLRRVSQTFKGKKKRDDSSDQFESYLNTISNQKEKQINNLQNQLNGIKKQQIQGQSYFSCEQFNSEDEEVEMKAEISDSESQISKLPNKNYLKPSMKSEQVCLDKKINKITKKHWAESQLSDHEEESIEERKQAYKYGNMNSFGRPNPLENSFSIGGIGRITKNNK